MRSFLSFLFPAVVAVLINSIVITGHVYRVQVAVQQESHFMGMAWVMNIRGSLNPTNRYTCRECEL
ncbi:hypothetical protein L21SP2_0357 [Salinispira pacifica]|uniref:Uncharacterized protein n=1 Tax=Salinispira pacifica TaxID=1307761 RepID=V5WD89_9SPIO|nr:hypothetical protein L21SP2_0357 [Salinispira pacifica]